MAYSTVTIIVYSSTVTIIAYSSTALPALRVRLTVQPGSDLPTSIAYLQLASNRDNESAV